MRCRFLMLSMLSLSAATVRAEEVVTGAIADGASHKLREQCKGCANAAALAKRYPHLATAGLLTSLDDEVDWAAIMEAVLKQGDSANTVRLPTGSYFIADEKSAHKTLEIDNPVNLAGDGGLCDVNPNYPHAHRCATTLTTQADAVALKYTRRKIGNILVSLNHWATVRDLGIRGSNGSGRRCEHQHGLQIDNEGLMVQNVSIGWMGGEGILLDLGVGSQLVSVSSRYNHLDGLFIEGGDSAATTILGSHFSNNERDGIRLRPGASAIAAIGVGVEHNGKRWEVDARQRWDKRGNEFKSETGGYGIRFEDRDGAPWRMLGNRFIATTDEDNESGSVRFGATAYYNWIDYTRFSSGGPDYGPYPEKRGNLVTGVDFGPKDRRVEPEAMKQLLEAQALHVFQTIGVGTPSPHSSLQVKSGYLQLPVVHGRPPDSDCRSADDAGRVVVAAQGSPTIYVCRGATGWSTVR